MTAQPTDGPATEPTNPDDGKKPESEPTPPAAPSGGHDRLPDDHPVVKALAKANEEAKAARLKVKEFEDANKSDLERATSAAAEATTRAEQAELRALRLEVAADKGLSARMAARLQGATREELEADAEELLEEMGPADDAGAEKRPPVTRRPKERLRGGPDPEQDPAPDLEKVVSKIPRL